ncbi:hypothetical protein MSG28_014806 [Choristoneura fumiferana]|uniref:Uncharacterized protein n=1 Tax=Choristoneura fumiferana TaxID=7141 RepID=A0ACC0JSS9_CHOFU|nr:hypothetical protein MSG28_014806 [Choristoneura fumiferana]
MAAPPIYNPVIPCVHPIPGGMFPGRMMRFQGNVPPGAQRFAINLQCGPNTDPRDDIALHLNFRFVEQCVVRNHLTAMAWGMEETGGGMPLNRGDNFEALLLCEPHSIKRISHLTVDGDVMMQVIAFEGAQPPQQMYMSEPPAYGAYGAPPAYGAPAYGGPPQGESKLILCFIAAG